MLQNNGVEIFHFMWYFRSIAGLIYRVNWSGYNRLSVEEKFIFKQLFNGILQVDRGFECIKLPLSHEFFEEESQKQTDANSF